MRGVVFGFLSFCLLPTSVLAVGYILHVGEYSFNLSQTKYTTPSLAFGTPNDGVWYGSLVKSNVQNTLKFKYNDTTYSLCEPFVDTENYTYDENGRLIDADGGIWLEGTGTQYIDTEFIPNPIGYKIELQVIITKKTTPSNFFGYNYSDNGIQRRMGIGASSNPAYLIYGYADGNSGYKSVAWLSINLPYQLVSNYIGTTSYLEANNTRLTTATGYANRSNPISVFLMAMNSKGKTNGAPSNMKLFNAKIYDENLVLVRHFVPVPACMRIGDFVVPENGMWDIVINNFTVIPAPANLFMEKISVIPGIAQCMISSLLTM